MFVSGSMFSSGSFAELDTACLSLSEVTVSVRGSKADRP